MMCIVSAASADSSEAGSAGIQNYTMKYKLHCSEPKQLRKCINEKVLNHVSLSSPSLGGNANAIRPVNHPSTGHFLRFVFKETVDT